MPAIVAASVKTRWAGHHCPVQILGTKCARYIDERFSVGAKAPWRTLLTSAVGASGGAKAPRRTFPESIVAAVLSELERTICEPLYFYGGICYVRVLDD